MVKREVMAIAMTTCMAVAMTACSSPETDETTAAANNEAAGGVPTMAINAEFPPYECHDGGEIMGIDVEIVRATAEKMDMTLEVEDIASDSIIPEVQSGKVGVDVVGVAVDEDRLQNVDSPGPYTASSQATTVQNDSEIAGPDNLAGKTIGVQLGTTGDIYASDYEEQGSTIKRYSKGLEVVQVIMQDKIDVVVIDQEPAKAFVSENESTRVLDEALTVEEHAIATEKGNTELVEKVSSTLAELKNSGEFQKIIDRYIPAN